MKRREYTKKFKEKVVALSNQEGAVSKSGPVDQWLLQLAPAAGLQVNLRCATCHMPSATSWASNSCSD